MSSAVNSGLAGPVPVLMQSQSLPTDLKAAESEVHVKVHKRVQESESESESDTTSEEDEDTSDDDQRMADNPILKERLKQLDRYATPIRHPTHSPVPASEQVSLPNLYGAGIPTSDAPSLPIYGGSNGPSDLLDGSQTPQEYRVRRLSVVESPNPGSGPASLNTSVTPKHNFSPSYGIAGSGSLSGPSSQHEPPGTTASYNHLPKSFPCKPGDRMTAYHYGAALNDAEPAKIEDSDDSREHVCEVCHAVYANRSSLRSHMKKHINHVSKRHQCDQCPYSTQYGKNLFKHVESMHTADKGSQFRCEGCSRCFSSEILLRDHECLLSQCNAYRCNECGRVFKTKLRLKYHADIHNPRKPYVCDIEGCDRAFRTPKYLKNHRDEFHRMQPKNYLCPVEGCDLIFHRKTHLKRHIATHDDAEKKYHCQWPSCQRRFCSEETLNLHYRKHTGEKPFNCALCLFNCYNKPTLNEHYRLNHAKDATAEGPYKSYNPSVSPLRSQPIRPENFNYNSGHPEAESVSIRETTPMPIVRHRMADILESCASQPPGPLDAEINGILDSLDKESDLPDLFSSGNFEFEHSGADSNFKSQLQHANSDRIPAYGQNNTQPVANSGATGSTFSSNENEEPDSSLTNVLSTILADLQRADVSGSPEEFEKAKANALTLLPTFSTGQQLERQIDAIISEFLESFSDQPIQILRAMFYATRPFTSEESYMVESLEHQLAVDSQLIAPTPPRRRGRRPKLQQQLQPYLQRIYALEPGTAEAMASHLVNVAQHERSSGFYGICHNMGYVRGRGRGCRIRGRSGRPLSLTLRLLPDGTAARASSSMHPVYRPQGIGTRGMGAGRKIRGGIRGRYRIDRPSAVSLSTYNPGADSELAGPMDRFHDPRCFGNSRSSMAENQYGHSLENQDEVDASMQLRATNKTPTETDEEIDELSEADDGEVVTDREYNVRDERNVPQEITSDINLSEDGPMMDRFELQKSRDCQTNREVVNQDTLGEMLEDLGVIVKRIGERAAARRQPDHQESPVYGQPLNLTDMGSNEQTVSDSVASLIIGGSKTPRSRSENLVPSVQLPSMAALASAGMGTPASAGASTPGRLSNPDNQVQSPHFSGSVSQHPSSAPPPHGSNQSNTPLSDINGPSAEEVRSSSNLPPSSQIPSNTTEYKSVHNEYQRPAPMWSCESMCCPATRGDGAMNVDNAGLKSNYSDSPAHTESVARPSNMFLSEDNSDISQSYHPTDLSTRMLGYNNNSLSPQDSPASPKTHRISSPGTNESATNHPQPDFLPPYSAQLSSSAAAMGSLMSAVEAVDHLRSLSALGAKYTASLGMGEDIRHSRGYQNIRLPNYQYMNSQFQQETSPVPTLPNSQRDTTSPIAAFTQPNVQDMFTAPGVPSALNSLLCSRKGDSFLASPTGLNGNGPCSPPQKNEFTGQTNSASGGTLGAYSSYQSPTVPSRCPSRNRSDFPGTGGYPLPTAASISTCSSVSSSSSSARSYLQDLYQQREQQYQQHQQQHQVDVKSPVNELTTRQLLSEAAATAYAHGLGRCDGQSFMGGLPLTSSQHLNHPAGSPRLNSYSSGASFSPNPYHRYSQPDSGSYSHPTNLSDTGEHNFPGVHPTVDFASQNGSGTYLNQNDAYNLYSPHLRQSSLSRSNEQGLPQTATHLAHSIHEVSGLAAAEAAAAAAYAYHQYHQQQQASRQGLGVQSAGAHSHYPNLLNPSPRNYYPGQLEEHFSPRDLALYTAYSERRDPKSAYLAETYRGTQATPGRFLF
ncbi:unnamed protein product [Calicophoron daubneyi]|uniref:C2H2-type domain-containing protein n=1 Tax=Calicophoron daubneyi TaxID=300641 RepID=A0AAV2TA92_CALDB